MVKPMDRNHPAGTLSAHSTLGEQVCRMTAGKMHRAFIGTPCKYFPYTLIAGLLHKKEVESTARRFAGNEPGREDSCVIEDEHVSGFEIVGEIAEASVLHAALPGQNEKPRPIPLFVGPKGDPIRGQREIEISGLHTSG
jgi:hypothetical protein